MISESVNKISRDIMYVSEQPLLLQETLQRVIHCILLERKSIRLTSIHSKLIMLKVYCDYFLILSPLCTCGVEIEKPFYWYLDLNLFYNILNKFHAFAADLISGTNHADSLVWIAMK